MAAKRATDDDCLCPLPRRHSDDLAGALANRLGIINDLKRTAALGGEGEVNRGRSDCQHQVVKYGRIIGGIDGGFGGTGQGAPIIDSQLETGEGSLYGGGDGTMDTIRGMFTSGFAMGEVLEGVAQSLPDGIRERLAEGGIRGLFGPPRSTAQLRPAVEALASLVQSAMRSQRSRAVPLSEALTTLDEAAGDDAALKEALGMLRELNSQGEFDEVPFDTVWTLLQAATRSDG